jgi:hypothetical protein
MRGGYLLGEGGTYGERGVPMGRGGTMRRGRGMGAEERVGLPAVALDAPEVSRTW